MSTLQKAMELPVLGLESYGENLSQVCIDIAQLPISSQAQLARSWALLGVDKLKTMLAYMQRLVSERVISECFDRNLLMNDDTLIASYVYVIRIVYYASLLGGVRYEMAVWDNAKLPVLEEDVFSSVEVVEEKIINFDGLSKELDLSSLDVRKPLIDVEEFANDDLNKTIEIDRDFARWKMPGNGGFSFMSNPFVLKPENKALALFYDFRMRQLTESRMEIFRNLNLNGTFKSDPYLNIKVRRAHIIADALAEISAAVTKNPHDLKKQLKVVFEAEEGELNCISNISNYVTSKGTIRSHLAVYVYLNTGIQFPLFSDIGYCIDEGGLSKEFFQLIVSELFNEDYGMFVNRVESRTFWFNPYSFESCGEFTLIGIVLGLAITNNVTLDLHLPTVMYRKLEGKRGGLEDLEDFDWRMWRGLKDLLMYDEKDFEEIFFLSFEISFTDMFGMMITRELKDRGSSLVVNQQNKKEYVNLYCDFLLNRSVEKQFLAFKRGFELVTGESPLYMLFDPKELELLLCGEECYDMVLLEQSTVYDGIDETSLFIRWFWEIVHAMDLTTKKSLLTFVTGSDRIPIGGLKRLNFKISINGQDDDRLPSAHTCFNVLMMPAYKSKKKMNEMVTKALEECRGFGML